VERAQVLARCSTERCEAPVAPCGPVPGRGRDYRGLGSTPDQHPGPMPGSMPDPGPGSTPERRLGRTPVRRLDSMPDRRLGSTAPDRPGGAGRAWAGRGEDQAVAADGQDSAGPARVPRSARVAPGWIGLAQADGQVLRSRRTRCRLAGIGTDQGQPGRVPTGRIARHRPRWTSPARVRRGVTRRAATRQAPLRRAAARRAALQDPKSRWTKQTPNWRTAPERTAPEPAAANRTQALPRRPRPWPKLETQHRHAGRSDADAAPPDVAQQAGPSDAAVRRRRPVLLRSPQQQHWPLALRHTPRRDAPECCVAPRSRGARCHPGHRERQLGRRHR
jgi:hypothetical protein